MKKAKIGIGITVLFLIAAFIGTNLFHMNRFSDFQTSAEMEIKRCIYEIGEYLDSNDGSLITDSDINDALKRESYILHHLLFVYDSSLSNNGRESKVKSGVSDLDMLILAFDRLLDNVKYGADLKTAEQSFQKLREFFEPLKIEDHGKLHEIDLKTKLADFADDVYHAESMLSEVIREADRISTENQ